MILKQKNYDDLISLPWSGLLYSESAGYWTVNYTSTKGLKTSSLIRWFNYCGYFLFKS